CARTPGAYW
nr:immunoglobulin heavy chain junction region [Mus musculus]MBK4184597.1 immunoglobulin heavy chain junction region [Mus musculus]MBK4184598.1 immunoglobulin heavy chain junction region [Mus musculus]MBK4184599.1 immunoglobulin heavy chain junction region [Mus musculus]MBK4184616.1 immunoglobulin heavy chain junction region [Mus musculus]